MPYIRRYTSFPSLTELAKIEGTVIIDQTPAQPIAGIATGFACVVGEFVKGPYGYPVEVSSAQDLADQFGGWKDNLGEQTTVGGLNTTQKTYDGNGYIALLNKKFARLAVLNVDQCIPKAADPSSRVTVQISRTLNTYAYTPQPGPSLAAPWAMSPADTVVFTTNTGAYTATFNATAAGNVGGDLCETAVAENYDLSVNNVLTIKVNRGSTQTVTLAAGYFVNPAAATAEEVALAINTLVTGVQAITTTAGTKVEIKTDKKGTGSYIQVTGGTANGILQFPTGEKQGAGNVSDISAVTMAEALIIINAVLGVNGVAWTDDGSYIKVRTTTAGATGSIIVSATAGQVAMGFDVLPHVGVTGGTGEAGTIPAGTTLSDGGSNRFATLEDVVFTATDQIGIGAETGSTSIRIRPANAAVYGGATVIAHAINTVVDTITFNGVTQTFVVDNTNASGSFASVIASRYTAAIDSLLARTSPARDVQLLFSARHSTTINLYLSTHVSDASEQGVGRRAFVSPPLNTSKTTARGTTTVGAKNPSLRNERIIYNYPGWQTYHQDLGYDVDVTSDSFMASIVSQINPEENPCQYLPNILGGRVTALESNAAYGGGIGELVMTDYINFKTDGICAPTLEYGPQYESCTTTSSDSSRIDIARTGLADFISDSLAARAMFYVKKTASTYNKDRFLSEADLFLADLVSAEDPQRQRIDSYSIDGEAGNTDATIAAKVWIVQIKVRKLMSMAVIPLNMTVGDTVTIEAA